MNQESLSLILQITSGYAFHGLAADVAVLRLLTFTAAPAVYLHALINLGLTAGLVISARSDNAEAAAEAVERLFWFNAPVVVINVFLELGYHHG